MEEKSFKAFIVQIKSLRRSNFLRIILKCKSGYIHKKVSKQMFQVLITGAGIENTFYNSESLIGKMVVMSDKIIMRYNNENIHYLEIIEFTENKRIVLFEKVL